MHSEEIFRLAKPKKKGILPLIFSRFLIIVLLLVLQVLLMVSFYGWLGEYIPYLTVVSARCGTFVFHTNQCRTSKD